MGGRTDNRGTRGEFDKRYEGEDLDESVLALLRQAYGENLSVLDVITHTGCYVHSLLACLYQPLEREMLPMPTFEVPRDGPNFTFRTESAGRVSAATDGEYREQTGRGPEIIDEARFCDTFSSFVAARIEDANAHFFLVTGI